MILKDTVYVLITESHSIQKGLISPSSEGNSYTIVKVDAFTHYVALSPVAPCNDYYAYTTFYEHWIAKLGLLEILATDNGTEFINNEKITPCHLDNLKQKPRIFHTFGLMV